MLGWDASLWRGVDVTTEFAAPAASAPELTEAVSRLRATFASGRTRSIDWREQQLRAMVRLVLDNEAAIGEAVAADLGRDPFESWLAEIIRLVRDAEGAARNLRRWTKRRRRMLELAQMPGRAWFQYEPYGTVLIIGPWNVPFALTLGPAVAAIAAGNTVVLKPSEGAPACSALMAELARRYLDTEAIAVIEGDAAVSQQLISVGFDRIFFTGGTEAGRSVYESAARQLTPVTLELGGKNPVIVTTDADVEIAAKRIAWIKLVNSGQACIAPDYVLADASIRDDLVTHIRQAFSTFEPHAATGKRIVNRRHFDRLVTALTATKGTVAVGGGSDLSRLTIEPTIVIDPDPREPLMSEEIFGPILPVVTVHSLDEAIAFVNARPKPLAAYIFTAAKSVRERVITEVAAGGMVFNHLAFQWATTRLPFGGVGPSGIGAYHGKWGFQEFSHRKSVLTKPTRPDTSGLLYPPYTQKKWNTARRIF